METFSAWLTIFVVSLIAVITPGPDFMLTLRSSLVYSRQAGIYTAIGVGAGNMIHAMYSLQRFALESATVVFVRAARSAALTKTTRF
jgi:threonine/homoserine/homoserine lactone efflux protein